MSRIKQKDTAPELVVRKLLHGMGYRFRLHRKQLFGTPDITLPKHKAVIFVHGCFWHGHSCKRGKAPKTNKNFWQKKIIGNVARDKDNITKLTDSGFRVLVVWECQTREKDSLIEILKSFLVGNEERKSMARRSGRTDPEKLRDRLIELLTNFERHLNDSDLRTQVLQLVPANHILRDLGSSLQHDENLHSARDRILSYLRKHPFIIVHGDELMIVAGISEYARRLRELRVEHGWQIISGVTVLDMKANAEAEDKEELETIPTMKPDEYMLIAEEQDRDAAFRWRAANQIRKRSDLSVRSKILDFFRVNVSKTISGEELRYVAGNKSEWARRTRELRTEYGWPITTRTNGRPDLPVGMYVLEEDRQSPEHDRKIPDATRRTVLQRDGYACQQCGWTHNLWNPSDPRHLEAHHIHEHAAGGGNETDNLITYCNICHDKAHTKS